MAAPQPAELERLLAEELARLGIDPAKAGSAAPSAESVVFDLQARVVEPGELQEDSPSGILLSWTERLVGDYNQDGEVGTADLTPLGQRYGEQVLYDHPEQHDGLAYWPLGDPDDDGDVAPGDPPSAGSGADNWRKARVDGNADGLIYLSDITLIAQHWQERLTGYRIYRWHDITGETELLANPDDADSPLTVPRVTTFPPDAGAADPLRPVRYMFLDEIDASGTHKYVVAPYSVVDVVEGPHSAPAGTYRNAAPIAVLAVSQYQSGSGLCTLDAGSSYDPDGQIARYEWDLDGDALFELDSGGQPVIEHIYKEWGIEEAAVRVTDNDGAQDTALQQINVTDPVVAHFTAAPTRGQPPLTVRFDPALSCSPFGVTEYIWDFDVDGLSYEKHTAPEVVGFTYETPGEYHPTLKTRDASPITAEYTAVVTVEPPAGLFVALSPKYFDGLLTTMHYTATTWNAEEPVTFAWDTNGDGSFDRDTGQRNTCQVTFTNPGLYTIKARARDTSGAEATATAEATLSALPVAVLDIPEVVYGAQEVMLDASASYDLDDGIVSYDWLVSGDLEWTQENGESVIALYLEPGYYEIAVVVTDHYGYQALASETLTVLSLTAVDLRAHAGFADRQPNASFEIAIELGSGASIESIELDMGDGTTVELPRDYEHLYDYTYAPGSYQATVTVVDSRGSIHDSAAVFIAAGLSIIRADGGAYDANYDAIVADLTALEISFDEVMYEGGVGDVLDPAYTGAIIWYRGGPGADGEPPVYTTLWTEAEIDDYIQLLRDGHRVLLMSQSHGREPGVDFDIEQFGDGWQGWYGDQLGWQILNGSIGNDDIRHPWAAGLGTDQGVAGADSYGSLESAPRNIQAAAGFGAKGPSSSYDDFYPMPAERYWRRGQLGDIPVSLSFSSGRQFTGIGFDDSLMRSDGSANAAPGFVAGMELTPRFGDASGVALVSYGNIAAPDENIGFLPDYSHASGPGRLWVVGYPWAETAVVLAADGEMTRADLLHNIIAWLMTSD